MSRRSFELSGLDGTNPLGFLTAVGLLTVVQRSGEADARLRWRRAYAWVPVLEDVAHSDESELCRAIADALRGRSVSKTDEERRRSAQETMEGAASAVKQKRAEIAQRGLRRMERNDALEREVRPLEEAFQSKRHAWLEALRQAVPQPELALGKRIDCTPEEYREHAKSCLATATYGGRQALDLLAAFGSDVCRARNSKAIEATPFCFTTGSGHQNFLETVGELVARVTGERVRDALFETWQYRDERHSMRWDPTEDRRYALLDHDPSGERVRTVWMANLLAYHALTLFPAAPSAHGVAVVGWNRDTDPPTFTWPIWEFPATPDVVRTLLQLRSLTDPQPDRTVLRERGIVAAYRTQRIAVGDGIQRKLNFTPARQV